MTVIEPRPRKSHTDLAREWDQLAEERHQQIASGEDLSFDHVVIPTVWQLLEGADRTAVLDIGCGTGDFTVKLAKVSGKVIAVEPSPTSMAVARRVCASAENVEFVEGPLEQAAVTLPGELATSAVAVMSLMATPDITEFAKALALLLQAKGRFAAVLTHPWFWPKYWGYDAEPWFIYGEEIFIEAPFVISRHTTGIRTTHVHRPLEQYIRVFSDCGFQLLALVEPMPSMEVQDLYPVPWRFPRFLGMQWEKKRSSL